MSTDLPAGGNTVLEVDGRPVHQVLVGLGWRVPEGAPFEVTTQMAVLGQDGRVVDREDFVPVSALRGDQSPSVAGSAAGAEDDVDQILLGLDGVGPSAVRLSFSAAIYGAVPRGQSFRQVGDVFIRVADVGTGRQVARHVLAPAVPGSQEVTAVVLGELYRHRGGWKFRAVGQGYAGGLAAVARDVGVDPDARCG